VSLDSGNMMTAACARLARMCAEAGLSQTYVWCMTCMTSGRADEVMSLSVRLLQHCDEDMFHMA